MNKNSRHVCPSRSRCNGLPLPVPLPVVQTVARAVHMCKAVRDVMQHRPRARKSPAATHGWQREGSDPPPPPPFSRRRRPSDDTCRAARHDIPGRLEWQHFSPVYTVRQCAPTHALFGPSRRCGEAAKPSKFITSGWSLWHGGGLLVSVDVTYLLLIVVC